jgi:acetaldehyde dehydrogenase/alcohol dehydrogenase
MKSNRTAGLDIDAVLSRSVQAGLEFRRYDQKTTDRIVRAVCEAGYNNRVHLAKMAVEETGIGRWKDKVIKNIIATKYVFNDIKHLKTVGVVSEDEEHGVVEVAVPLGPLFAVTPITNPTSTVLFKILIALKSRNPIIIRPHGAARKCSCEAARICYEAALSVGAPENCIQWVRRSTVQELLDFMGHMKTAMVLATGSMSLVRAAYRSGNPAIGVGPGNVPCYIGRSADVPFAVGQIFLSKTFDNGTVCASEQAVVTNRFNCGQVKEEFKKRGAYFLSGDEIPKLERAAFNLEEKVMRIDVIGKPAPVIAAMAGIDVPPETTMLVAELQDVGLHSPLSLEILAPVLAFYVAENFEKAIELCRKINLHGGVGHTASIYSNDEKKIEYFSAVMNAGRILVNTPASQGAMGGTYNSLVPSLMLGCGTSCSTTTTDNISVRHLLHIHRIARRKKEALIEDFDDKKLFDESFGFTDLE